MSKTVRFGHRDLEIKDHELVVINTRFFQRLLFIKQLATTCKVYPGATHTRYEHALDSLDAAQHIIEGLRREDNGPSPEDAQLIRFSCLLHDISHIPYGHVFGG